jgi:hypothetical protein
MLGQECSSRSAARHFQIGGIDAELQVKAGTESRAASFLRHARRSGDRDDERVKRGNDEKKTWTD